MPLASLQTRLLTYRLTSVQQFNQKKLSIAKLILKWNFPVHSTKVPTDWESLSEILNSLNLQLFENHTGT